MSFVFHDSYSAHDIHHRSHPRMFFRVIFSMWLAILVLGFVAVLGLPSQLIRLMPCGAFRMCEASATTPDKRPADDPAAIGLASLLHGSADAQLTRKQMIMYLKDMTLKRGVIDDGYVAATINMELTEFADISPLDPAYAAVKMFSRRGILKGKKIEERAGVFMMPDDIIRRSEMAALLVRGLELPIVISQGAPHFSDVGENSWFYRYVETLYSRGALRDSDQFYGGYLATEGFLQSVLEKL